MTRDTMAKTDSTPAQLHPIEKKILDALKTLGDGEKVDTESLAKLAGIDPTSTIRMSYWLSEKGLVTLTEETEKSVRLTKTGEDAARNGIPERALLDMLGKNGDLPIKDLKIQEKNIAIGQLRGNGLCTIENGVVQLTPAGRAVHAEESRLALEDDLELLLKQSSEGGAGIEELKHADTLIKRGLMKKTTSKQFIVTITAKGLCTATTAAETTGAGLLVGELTPKILKTASWKNHAFRHYNVADEVPLPVFGRLHPLQVTLERVRNAFLRMGFTELRGGFVESSFWCFDALFQPQDHPARELADTFFMKEPVECSLPEKSLVDRVKGAHETGVCGSCGWEYSWNEGIARLPVLRTHTTSVSARALEGAKPPIKVFTIDKAFRNEALDYKHLMELHQVDGIVFEENVTFKHLLGYLKEFFRIMGFEKVRFRPAYFPYTEMSVEPEVFIPEKNEWMELGGSGIFRPEVVEPLTGIDAPVLAWGLGLERLAMLTFGVENIRKLYTNDLSWLRSTRGRWMIKQK